VDRETIDPGDGGDPIVAQSNEGLPRAVLEAMSLGVPAIASRIAGVGEQIEDGVTGLIVPQADPPALAAAIVRIATDGALRDRMGARARQVVSERFTVDAAARGLAEVLQQTSRRSTKASA
jgi:glycosyltransferase involved in cell wall biosynthesis